MRNLLATTLGLALISGPAGAASGSGSFNFSAQVPVICKLSYQGGIMEQTAGFRLGQLLQYCNSPNGFIVSLDYSPGSLRNTALRIGDKSIVLDGSGHAELFRGDGPQVRVLEVSAIPGSAGFDADQLTFHIEPN